MSGKVTKSDSDVRAKERLQERAKCLSEMLSMPAAPPILIANEIALILRAGIECYGEALINERMAFIERCGAASSENSPKKFVQETDTSVVN